MKIRFLFIFPFLFFFSFVSYTQIKEHNYSDSSITCTYYTTQGRIDGKYISYYKNGKKKAEGSFRNNYHYGIWTLYDSSGNISIKRDYKNPFSYEQLYPCKKSKDTLYELKQNKDAYIDYFPLQEKMVMLAKRVWRYIPAENNALLFGNNILQKIISSNLSKGNITAYSTKDDEFTTPLKSDEIRTNDINVIGYKIKEDWFFDNVRMVSESRILGLCPIVVDTLKHDTTDLYWIYFPEIRKYLAAEKLSEKNLPDEISNVDDLFFYRCFASSIYKESNFKDRKISDYKKGDEILKEAERIEINMIEMEHDLWKTL
jgi:hypothetical protein